MKERKHPARQSTHSLTSSFQAHKNFHLPRLLRVRHPQQIASFTLGERSHSENLQVKADSATLTCTHSSLQICFIFSHHTNVETTDRKTLVHQAEDNAGTFTHTRYTDIQISDEQKNDRDNKTQTAE